MLDAIISWDHSLTLAINQAHSATADQWMMVISHKLTWIPLYGALLFILYKVFGWKRALAMLGFIVLNVILTDQISVFMKESFMRLRPCHDPALSPLLHLADGCGGRFGFVSSHASNTMGLAVLISLLLRNRGITIAMMAFAVLNSYSRVYLGKHFVLDVVAGCLLGALLAYGVYRLCIFTIKRLSIR